MNNCSYCGKPVITSAEQSTDLPDLHEECRKKLSEEIDAKMENKPVKAIQNHGNCPLCGTSLVALDGGDGCYCPDGCLI